MLAALRLSLRGAAEAGEGLLDRSGETKGLLSVLEALLSLRRFTSKSVDILPQMCSKWKTRSGTRRRRLMSHILAKSSLRHTRRPQALSSNHSCHFKSLPSPSFTLLDFTIKKSSYLGSWSHMNTHTKLASATSRMDLDIFLDVQCVFELSPTAR